MGNFRLSGFADEIDRDLSVQLDVLKTLGMDHLEMRGVNGKNVSELSVDEATAVKKQLDESGVRVSAIGSPIGKIKITDDFAPELDRFKHILEIAQIMDTRYIRLFSFYLDRERADEFRGEVIARWRRCAAAAEGSGIILLHENEKGIYGDTAERCKDLLDAIGSDFVRATFDPANFVQCGVSVFPDAYELLKDKIEYVHIKDAKENGEIVPAGGGAGQIKALLRALKADGYDGFLSLEPHLGAFEGLAALEENLDVSRLPKGGAQTFAVAHDALLKILSAI